MTYVFQMLYSCVHIESVIIFTSQMTTSTNSHKVFYVVICNLVSCSSFKVMNINRWTIAHLARNIITFSITKEIQIYFSMFLQLSFFFLLVSNRLLKMIIQTCHRKNNIPFVGRLNSLLHNCNKT